ncbi:N-acetylglucosamine-1-phosphodiester alpha-N-acetylglucosaminidase-like [Antedon mediterranea]|uniref:N-acetylglucosamine-1-phosphodiester alpha-N-acetylglucosaminidase-like n=1 Tax=Antedon mediterranea TaxID=105859 RepID=UPI003AF97247
MDMRWELYIFITHWLWMCNGEEMGSQIMVDVLSPYKLGEHNPKKLHREVRDCQPVKYGNVTHTIIPSHGQNSSTITLPITTTKRFVRDFQTSIYEKRTSGGHITFINNPSRTLSVLEPLENGGCGGNRRATVLKSSEQRKCIVSMNAGFFNTHTGECLGNIVSGGRRVKNSNGIQNAHFGIKQDGSLVFGYLSEEDVENTTNPFIQLVGGVGWLLRNGEVYVDESIKVECDETEETGSAKEFFEVVSARTAIGSDAEGRVVLVNIDGQTRKFGVNLRMMAEFLKELGVVDAINLDGGGSATYVINGTVVDYPTDTCTDREYNCARQVSTIICAHEPECQPENCSNHGDCILGTCHCHDNWKGARCDELFCGSTNCGEHGKCTNDGCVCEAGWEPPFCIFVCAMGHYGVNCEGTCQCQNGAICNVSSGACSCLPGYRGVFCDEVCPVGFYGQDCLETCYCPGQSCFCHHVTGNCDVSKNNTNSIYLLQTAKCMADEVTETKGITPVTTNDKEKELFIGFVTMTCIAAVSILCNIFLLCFQCACRCRTKPFRSKNKLYARISESFESE